MRVTQAAEMSVTSQARRDQLIGAAVEVIADTGLAGASFARIARRAGVASTRMISYHFTSRDDLVRAVVSAVSADAAEAIEAYLPADAGPAEQLRGIVRGNLLWAASHRREVAALLDIWHGHRDDDGRPVYGLPAHELEFQMVGQLLAAGQEAGEFRAFEPRPMAVMLRHLLNGVAELIATEPTVDVESLIDETTRAVERATSR